MEIRFSKHALEKFKILARHGVVISKKQVIKTIQLPMKKDYRRLPLLIVQSNLDTQHVLRVVYRKDQNDILVITFYPGRKLQYEK